MHTHTCIYTAVDAWYSVTSTEAVVGLERTFFTVSEDVGVVELCASILEPAIECPIEFPFNVILSTTDKTAGMYYTPIN